jgi:hypothetical protein
MEQDNDRQIIMVVSKQRKMRRNPLAGMASFVVIFITVSSLWVVGMNRHIPAHAVANRPTPITTHPSTGENRPPKRQVQPASGRVRVRIAGSRNWAGYSAVKGVFTSVSGTWTVPSISSSGHTATDATWVGIGGIRSLDLIQSGTQDVINTTGQVISEAWVEMLPNFAQPLPLTVSSGDSVTVSLTNTGPNQWQLSFRDTTTGQNYQTTLSYASSFSSAEWIEEAPSNGVNLLPLDNFGTVSFSNCSSVSNGSQATISQSAGQSITMLNARGQKIAVPSPLASTGAGFTVTRTG